MSFFYQNTVSRSCLCDNEQNWLKSKIIEKRYHLIFVPFKEVTYWRITRLWHNHKIEIFCCHTSNLYVDRFVANGWRSFEGNFQHNNCRIGSCILHRSIVCLKCHIVTGDCCDSFVRREKCHIPRWAQPWWNWINIW